MLVRGGHGWVGLSKGQCRVAVHDANSPFQPESLQFESQYCFQTRECQLIRSKLGKYSRKPLKNTIVYTDQGN